MEVHKANHKDMINEKYVKVFWYTMLETVVILAVSLAQIYLIRTLLDNKILR